MAETLNFNHKPVLLAETIELLNINSCGTYVDATAGGGGHSKEILEKLTNGKLISIDQDPDAIAVLQNKFASSKNVEVIKGNFSQMDKLLGGLGICDVDGILMDIGVSSFQLDEGNRGFSYHKDAALDMRMSKEGISAADVVNTYSETELVKLLSTYGEEKFACNIARNIVKHRQTKPINTTLELSEIVKESYPAKFKKDSHPARKTFQALRIEVNDELGVLKKGMDAALSLLNSKGRIAIITFHSLEDRIVKEKMKEWAQACICPPQFPVCVCGNNSKVKLINKKPLQASQEELANNQRSRSAKLRVCEKI